MRLFVIFLTKQIKNTYVLSTDTTRADSHRNSLGISLGLEEKKTQFSNNLNRDVCSILDRMCVDRVAFYFCSLVYVLYFKGKLGTQNSYK